MRTHAQFGMRGSRQTGAFLTKVARTNGSENILFLLLPSKLMCMVGVVEGVRLRSGARRLRG